MNFGEALQALKGGRVIKREKQKVSYFMASNKNVQQFQGVIVRENNNEFAYETSSLAKFYGEDILAEDWQIVD